MAANLPDFVEFLQLEEEQLILVALDTYHIKLAKSYYAEHSNNEIYSTDLYRDYDLDLTQFGIKTERNVSLLRARKQSRHSRAKQYYTYILVNAGAERRDAFKRYYCTCLTARHTIGTCAHVISILWYMYWAHHQDVSMESAANLNDVTLMEASIV